MALTGPLWALKPSTIEVLSIELNSKKEILTEDGHLRDWRGLAELSGLTNLMIQKIGDSSDPTQELFNQWKKTTNVNIEDVFQYLEVIDRFDVIDDNRENVKKDVAFAYKIVKEKGLAKKDIEASFTDYAKEALTYDDLIRLNKGLDLMHYDAFILYGDDDNEFAGELSNNLEKQGLKICIKDRDLLGGAFEHEAVMKLIAERCRKLVPIFSPSFFSSENNKFLTTFGQYVSIEKSVRSLVPVLYKTCNIPPNLSLYHKLVYRSDNTLVNFWKKLTDSIKPGTYRIIEENGSSKVVESLEINKHNLSSLIHCYPPPLDSSSSTSLKLESQESRDLLLPEVPKVNLIAKIRRKIFNNKKSKNKYTKEAFYVG